MHVCIYVYIGWGKDLPPKHTDTNSLEADVVGKLMHGVLARLLLITAAGLQFRRVLVPPLKRQTLLCLRKNHLHMCVYIYYSTYAEPH